ncbi:dihydrofolate reductase family protein [Asanoa iriomotensis]|uniref:Bacterial bifunctional deaminase-reductase C-terminal domain-containing protein n=1 Tax=Asanoa iriomotensis TaxID=234613 RepID=A0ABQ4CFJ1_9ACTN|nr:dihydrofolate reductase family protein [Asanoa iriomotensis]GIF61520.1 hypothetical protein Air01nite_76150 [Asanoa iriomotensis]
MTHRRAREAAGDKDVLVLGVDVSRQMLGSGLLDEVHLHLMPVLLGAGAPLFAGVRAELLPLGEPVGGAATHVGCSVVFGP